MKYHYFIFINDYDVVLHNPLEFYSDHSLNLGDILDFNMDEIGEELDIEYDTSSFRIVQRRYAPILEARTIEDAVCLTVIPHFNGINL